MVDEIVDRAFATAFDPSYDRFLDTLEVESIVEPQGIFVVSSPRVGSTFIYQQLINKLGCCYVSNFTNDFFSAMPAVGMYLERKHPEYSSGVMYRSEYGKTRGLFETSEASAVFANWFGGLHPSETKSCLFKSPQAEREMRRSVKAFNTISNSCFVTKNPWNSFRISAISGAIRKSFFIWIRRSIERAALSDLENRYQRGEPAEVWNSATTKDYLEIKKQPYWEQVVLQQASYSRAVSAALKRIGDDSYAEVWYEDLCRDPDKEISRIYRKLETGGFAVSEPLPAGEAASEVSANTRLAEDYRQDFAKISAFIDSDPTLSALRYSG